MELKECREAEKTFKGRQGAQLAKDISMRSKAFNPGYGLPSDKKKGGPLAGDVEAVKNASASTLAEVERLKGFLLSDTWQRMQINQAPLMIDGEEEREEDIVTHGF